MKKQNEVTRLAEDRWINTEEAKRLVDVSSRNGLYSFLNRHNITATRPKGSKRTRFDKYEILEVLDRNSFKMGL